MRMRPKKNRVPRLEKVKGLIANEKDGKIDLSASFEGLNGPLFVELGCGKGAFAVGLCGKYPDARILAVEKVTDVIMMAMEAADRNGCGNVRFVNADAAGLCDMLPEKSAERIYINFCDPWPKKRNAKRRLTSPLFLEMYKRILAAGGKIFFKTDNRPLFDYSLETFAACGYTVENVTYDLHASALASENIQTEYERNFSAKGFSINYLEAFLK